MRREAEWIRDAPDAAADIGGYTDSIDAAEFEADRRTRHAVQYCFVIIGEALSRLSRRSPELARRIPELDDTRGFRNVLAHEYDRVEPERIWEAIHDDLPGLELSLKTLLAEIEQADEPD